MIDALAPVFVGNMAYYRDSLLLPGEAATAMSSAALLAPAQLDACMARFGRQYPEGNPRAIASQWVKSYCMTLLPAVVLANLLLDRSLPLSLHSLGFVVADDGVPSQIVVSTTGESCAGQATFVRFHELVHDHLSPLFAVLEARWKLPRKIMWGQAGFLLGWVLGVAAAHPLRAGQSDPCDGRELITERYWPDGTSNPLFQPTRPVPIEGGIRHEKRVCCLSHQLEPNGGLCMGCPHHKKRAASCLKTAA